MDEEIKSLWYKSASFQYALFGVFFGFMFPILATLIHLVVHNKSFSFQNILYAHQTEPLLLIIDTAPLFLGVFAGLIGRKQDQLLYLVRVLENKLEQEEVDISDIKDELIKVHMS